MTIKHSVTRQEFFRLGARLLGGLGGILGLGGLVRFFSYQPHSGPPSVFDLGPAEDFPSEGRLLRFDIPAVIYRTGTGFQAFSLACTHLGCTLEENGEGFACPCHGSQFSAQGRLLAGPADQDLPPLGVEISPEGSLILDTGGANR